MSASAAVFVLAGFLLAGVAVFVLLVPVSDWLARYRRNHR